MKHANTYLNDKHVYRPLLDALVDVGALLPTQAEEANKLLNKYAKQAEQRLIKQLRKERGV